MRNSSSKKALGSIGRISMYRIIITSDLRERVYVCLSYTLSERRLLSYFKLRDKRLLAL